MENSDMVMITLDGNGPIFLCLFLSSFSPQLLFPPPPLDPLFPLCHLSPCYSCYHSAVWKSDPETKGEAPS